MFRIYRDVRFSKDKSPYKTQAAVHFRHEAGKTAHAPGFYLHLAPGEVGAGVGIWRPNTPGIDQDSQRHRFGPRRMGESRKGPRFSGRILDRWGLTETPAQGFQCGSTPISKTSSASTTSHGSNWTRTTRSRRVSWTTSLISATKQCLM